MIPGRRALLLALPCARKLSRPHPDLHQLCLLHHHDRACHALLPLASPCRVSYPLCPPPPPPHHLPPRPTPCNRSLPHQQHPPRQQRHLSEHHPSSSSCPCRFLLSFTSSSRNSFAAMRSALRCCSTQLSRPPSRMGSAATRPACFGGATRSSFVHLHELPPATRASPTTLWRSIQSCRFRSMQENWNRTIQNRRSSSLCAPAGLLPTCSLTTRRFTPAACTVRSFDSCPCCTNSIHELQGR